MADREMSEVCFKRSPPHSNCVEDATSRNHRVHERATHQPTIKEAREPLTRRPRSREKPDPAALPLGDARSFSRRMEIHPAATIGHAREARAQAGGGATRRGMLPGGTWKRQLRSKVR